MSQVGLKYYHDLLRKIPRAEVAGVEALCREHIFELVEDWGVSELALPFLQLCAGEVFQSMCCAYCEGHSGDELPAISSPYTSGGAPGVERTHLHPAKCLAAHAVAHHD